MHRRCLAGMVCGVLLLAGPAVVRSGPVEDGDAKEKAAAAGPFGLTRVVGVHVEMSADEYQAMQPPAPAAGFGAPLPPRSRSSPARGRASGTFSASSSRGRPGL